MGSRWMTELDRFEEKCTPEPNTGCWIWTGALAGGYGRFFSKGRVVSAHRYSYELKYGPIPGGLELDHFLFNAPHRRCIGPACVNPDHVESVTHALNISRGQTGARERSKVCCPAGHPYLGDNLYVSPSKVRQCRACGRAQYHARKERGCVGRI